MMSNDLTRYRAFDLQFMGPTNTLGARIRIRDLRRNDKVVISYDYECGDVLEQGLRHLNSVGIEPHVILLADKLDCYVIGSEDFTTDLIQ
tara:strand:+ start:3162 stop:3431 length:270 start_codon:yes stop_codon:yes gene_type:complete